jgi:hypothetical protein
MKDKYNITYQSRYNFLTWCQYWLKNGCRIRHTSWGKIYPSFKKVEYNSDELIEQYARNKYMHKSSPYFAKDENDCPCFFDKKTIKKGDWYAKPVNDIENLFE